MDRLRRDPEKCKRRFPINYSEFYRPWGNKDKKRLAKALKEYGESVRGTNEFIWTKTDDEILFAFKRYKNMCKNIYVTQCKRQAPFILPWINLSRNLTLATKLDVNAIINQKKIIGEIFNQLSNKKEKTSTHPTIFDFKNIYNYINNVINNEKIHHLSPFESLIVLSIIKEIEDESYNFKCLCPQLVSRAKNMRKCYGIYPRYFMTHSQEVIRLALQKKIHDSRGLQPDDAVISNCKTELTEQDIALALKDLINPYVPKPVSELDFFKRLCESNFAEDEIEPDGESIKTPFKESSNIPTTSGITIMHSREALITGGGARNDVNIEPLTLKPIQLFKTYERKFRNKSLVNKPTPSNPTVFPSYLESQNGNDTPCALLDGSTININGGNSLPDELDFSLRVIPKSALKKRNFESVTQPVIRNFLPQFFELPPALAIERHGKLESPPINNVSIVNRDRVRSMKNALIYMMNPFCLPTLEEVIKMKPLHEGPPNISQPHTTTTRASYLNKNVAGDSGAIPINPVPAAINDRSDTGPQNETIDGLVFDFTPRLTNVSQFTTKDVNQDHVNRDNRTQNVTTKNNINVSPVNDDELEVKEEEEEDQEGGDVIYESASSLFYHADNRHSLLNPINFNQLLRSIDDTFCKIISVTTTPAAAAAVASPLKPDTESVKTATSSRLRGKVKREVGSNSRKGVTEIQNPFRNEQTLTQSISKNDLKNKLLKSLPIQQLPSLPTENVSSINGRRDVSSSHRGISDKLTCNNVNTKIAHDTRNKNVKNNSKHHPSTPPKCQSSPNKILFKYKVIPKLHVNGNLTNLNNQTNTVNIKSSLSELRINIQKVDLNVSPIKKRRRTINNLN